MSQAHGVGTVRACKLVIICHLSPLVECQDYPHFVVKRPEAKLHLLVIWSRITPQQAHRWITMKDVLTCIDLMNFKQTSVICLSYVAFRFFLDHQNMFGAGA